jgi:predicted transcriptional regulator
MFNKPFLVKKVVNSLLKRDYEVLLSHGCFDIAAKRADRKQKQLMLVKVLINIDGLDQQQAMNLRTVSYFMSAHPFVVSMKNNREFLDKKTIYNRFGLPVVTPELFESILEEEAYAIQSAKGRHTVEIDTNALREKRKELQFTLEELAALVGISKKAMYEIEADRVNPTEKTVKKLEITLKTELKDTYKPKVAEETRLKPVNTFQSKVSRELKRIGIDNSPVQSAPVEIVGKEKYSVITGLSKNSVKMRREAPTVKKLSGIFSSSAFFVAKKTKEHEVEGVPVLLEDELPEVESAKELKKLIEEKE